MDLSSQIFGLVVFRNLIGNAALYQYWSRKCQRVTPSALAGEEIALTTVFDSAFMLRHAGYKTLGRRIPILALTDRY